MSGRQEGRHKGRQAGRQAGSTCVFVRFPKMVMVTKGATTNLSHWTHHTSSSLVPCTCRTGTCNMQPAECVFSLPKPQHTLALPSMGKAL